MTQASNSTELIVQIRVPADFRLWAELWLHVNELPVTDENVGALLQRDIDELMTRRRRGDDPPCCDPGGGMRSPE